MIFLCFNLSFVWYILFKYYWRKLNIEIETNSPPVFVLGMSWISSSDEDLKS